MNKKFKSLVYWAIFIWFFINGILTVVIVYDSPIHFLNYVYLSLGIFFMALCAYQEDKWFP